MMDLFERTLYERLGVTEFFRLKDSGKLSDAILGLFFELYEQVGDSNRFVLKA